ncbi:MAG: hypothetical protein ACXADB_10955, partial [Candidatus Hermodarchaeia archaeon]
SMVTLPGAFNLGGDTIWRVDTRIDEVRLHGTTVQGIPFAEQYTDISDPYNFYGNVDGDLHLVYQQVNGRLPGISVQSGLVGRWCMDEYGNYYSVGTNWNYKDPNLQSYELNERDYYMFWYSFEIVVETTHQQLIDAVGIKKTEYGTVGVDVVVEIHISLSDPNFDTDVDGHFGECWFYEVDYLGKGEGGFILPGVEYHMVPNIAIKQNIGTAIGFQNQRSGASSKTADLVFTQDMTGGAAKTDWHMLSELPAHVWVSKRVMLGMLLSQPVEVGGGTDPDPFDPASGIDWMNIVFSLAMIFVGIFIIYLGTRMGKGGSQNTIFNLIGGGLGLGLQLGKKGQNKEKKSTGSYSSNAKKSQKNFTIQHIYNKGGGKDREDN